jgi:preprotein translocase subunit SecY
MRMPSLSARFAGLRYTRGPWRGATWLLGGVLLCELAARISFLGLDGRALSKWFSRGEAGPLLRFYDRLAGFGMSRGTVAALGFMPYLSARVFTWLARIVSPTLDDRWSDEAGRGERTRWTRGLTFGLALVQSYGFARFTQTVPGVVTHPGPQHIAETMLVQTAVAMFLMWVAEEVTEPTGVKAGSSRTDQAAAGRALLDDGAVSSVFMSGQRTHGSSPEYVRHPTPTS